MKHLINKDQGFTLIEVLIAVLVLSIGLLGLAALQATSLRNNHSGYLRSQATLLAYDMIDRMRANRNVAVDTNAYVVDFGAAPQGGTNCQALNANCTNADMAVFDVSQWKCMLGNWDSANFCANTLNITGALPGGDGNITRVDDVYTIQIRYNEREGELNADTTTIEVRARLL